MLRPTLGSCPNTGQLNPMSTVINYELYCYGANCSFHWLVCSDGTNCQQIRLVLSCHSLERKARSAPTAEGGIIRAHSCAVRKPRALEAQGFRQGALPRLCLRLRRQRRGGASSKLGIPTLVLMLRVVLFGLAARNRVPRTRHCFEQNRGMEAC